MVVWGRYELRAGELWTSNSVIAGRIVRAGLDLDAVHLPRGGRAPVETPGSAWPTDTTPR